MTQTIRVVAADNHAVVRAGVRDLLSEAPDITIVGEARNGREAVEVALAQRPHVVLMEIALPELSGLEATRRIRDTTPSVRVLAFTAQTDGQYAEAMIGAGASGYLLKTATEQELRRAVRSTAAGLAVIDPAIASYLLARLNNPKPQTDALSKRELTVLELTARGQTNKQIGQALHLSARTVQNHLANIYVKLGVASRTEAVTVGIQRSLIALDHAAS